MINIEELKVFRNYLCSYYSEYDFDNYKEEFKFNLQKGIEIIDAIIYDSKEGYDVKLKNKEINVLKYLINQCSKTESTQLSSHPSQEVFNTMGDIAQLAMEKEIDLSYLDWLKTQKLYNLLIEEEQSRTKKIMRKIMKGRDNKYGEC
jgi:hypothetical protein